jgi:hypothetical protein
MSRRMSSSPDSTCEALHNGWDKNDPKDARVIPHLLWIGAAKPYHAPWCMGSTTCRSCR